MATVTIKHYGQWPIKALNEEIDFLDDTIKVLGTTSTHTPNQDTHEYHDDITNEVTGTNYTAGGVALTNKSIGYTAGTNVIKIDADDAVFTNVTISDFKNLHIYDDTPGTSATKPLIGFGVIDTALNPNAGNLTIAFDTAGILTLTAAA